MISFPGSFHDLTKPTPGQPHLNSVLGLSSAGICTRWLPKVPSELFYEYAALSSFRKSLHLSRTAQQQLCWLQFLYDDNQYSPLIFFSKCLSRSTYLLNHCKCFEVSFCFAFACLALGALNLWVRLPEHTAIQIKSKQKTKKITEYQIQV